MMTAIKNRNTQKQLMLVKSVLLFLFALTGRNKSQASIDPIGQSNSYPESFSSSRLGSITFRSSDLGSGDFSVLSSIFEAIFGSEDEVMLIK